MTVLLDANSHVNKDEYTTLLLTVGTSDITAPRYANLRMIMKEHLLPPWVRKKMAKMLVNCYIHATHCKLHGSYNRSKKTGKNS